MSEREGQIDPEFRVRLREALVRQATDERPVRRGTRLTWGLAAGVCLLAGVGTAWVLADPGSAPESESVAGRPEVRSVEVVCTSVPGPTEPLPGSGGALSDDRNITISVTIAGGSDAAPDLLEGCARLWDEGLLADVEFQNGSPQSSTESVPALAVCSLPDDAPVVVPAFDCRSVGMTDWTDANRPVP